METQLVISAVAEKYGHASSLGIKQVFSSSLQPLCIIFHSLIMPLFLLPACRRVLIMPRDGGRQRQEQGDKHGRLSEMLSNNPGRMLSTQSSDLHKQLHFLYFALRPNPDCDEIVSPQYLIQRKQCVDTQLFTLLYKH